MYTDKEIDEATEIVTLRLILKQMKAENDKLREDARFLDCLRAAGVDNWNGYEHAQDIMQETYGEEDG